MPTLTAPASPFRAYRGDIGMGPYADGAGEALYHLYAGGGMWSGVLIGGTGIGKSRIIESLAIGAMASACTVVWFIDPQGGASSPALSKHADWYVDEGGAVTMLNAALRVGKARADENTYEGWIGFTPSPARPGLLIIIDECHKIFTPEMAKRWSNVAREFRKVGVALLCASQYPGLETFGGNEALRSSIMAGNVIAMKTASNSAGQIMAGLQIDPKTLPNIKGYGWLQDTDPDGRSAPFRNRLAVDPDAWMAAQPKSVLDTLASTAAGEAYQRRAEIAETRRAELRSYVEALRNGLMPVEAPLRETGRPNLRVVEDTDLDLPEPLRPAPDGLSEAERAICAALADGAEAPKDLAEATGYTERHVNNLLKPLIDRRIAVRIGRGRYALIDNETDEATDDTEEAETAT